MKTARAFGARRMPSVTSTPCWSTGTGQTFTPAATSTRRVKAYPGSSIQTSLSGPCMHTDHDVEGLLGSRGDHDLFGVTPHGAGGPKIITNGFSQSEHAARIGVAKVLPPETDAGCVR